MAKRPRPAHFADFRRGYDGFTLCGRRIAWGRHPDVLAVVRYVPAPSLPTPSRAFSTLRKRSRLADAKHFCALAAPRHLCANCLHYAIRHSGELAETFYEHTARIAP